MDKQAGKPIRAGSGGTDRRSFLREAGLGAATAALGMHWAPALANGDHGHDRDRRGGDRKSRDVEPELLLFPTQYRAERSLAGRNVVITGASRGNGRATALELVRAGANVWGTSRTPGAYPHVFEYPLLPLRLEDPASIAAFVPKVAAATGGRVDVLINNAAQFVFGTTTPLDAAGFGIWSQNSALGLQVLYLGHRMVTAAMLGLMQHPGDRRILFTCSSAAYSSGSDVGSEFYQPYTAGKRALLDFANTLRSWLSLAGLGIGVSAVHPLATNTDLARGNRPIFLEAVDGAGNPAPASPLAQVVGFMRQALAAGQPSEIVGRAYRQLLELRNPPANVFAGVSRGALAEAGGLPLILAAAEAELEDSALQWRPAKGGR